MPARERGVSRKQTAQIDDVGVSERSNGTRGSVSTIADIAAVAILGVGRSRLLDRTMWQRTQRGGRSIVRMVASSRW
jgi:hypothetical protein